ncbi:MAG TPA: V4R domain-containing protein [Candidatus Thermoplasmatota archaeon]|nr:V4R domain-containing protein [Candidatus Thermoplasmatota archaeon]
MRAGLNALLDGLHKIAAPTGARGSVLLMTGGLIVLGFLFLAFLFRSAIVGDLAPVANGRAPTRRVSLPGAQPPAHAPPIPPRAFDAGRNAGRKFEPYLDASFDAMRMQGVDPRVLRTRAGWKIVRMYHCASCERGVAHAGCEYERGLLAGVFEHLSADLAKVHEVACRSRGDAFCEFEVRHAPVVGVE